MSQLQGYKITIVDNSHNRQDIAAILMVNNCGLSFHKISMMIPNKWTLAEPFPCSEGKNPRAVKIIKCWPSSPFCASYQVVVSSTKPTFFVHVYVLIVQIRIVVITILQLSWKSECSSTTWLTTPQHDYLSGLCVSTVMLRTGGQDLEPTKGNIVSQHFDLSQEWKVSLQVVTLKRTDPHKRFYFSSNLLATHEEPLIFFILLVVGMVMFTATGPLLFSSIIQKVCSLLLQ